MKTIAFIIIFTLTGGAAMAEEARGGSNNKGSRLSDITAQEMDPTQKRGALTQQELQGLTDPGLMMRRIVELSQAGEGEKMKALYEEYQRRFMQGDHPQEPLHSPRLVQPTHSGSLR